MKIAILITNKKNAFLNMGFSLTNNSKKESKNMKSPIPKYIGNILATTSPAKNVESVSNKTGATSKLKNKLTPNHVDIIKSATLLIPKTKYPRIYFLRYPSL
ncbi:hypothetical protein JCM8795_10400 [Hydrogenobaculum acidophilum]